MVLIVEAVPLAKRPMYMGFGGATFGLSAVLGPLVGRSFDIECLMEVVLPYQPAYWRYGTSGAALVLPKYAHYGRTMRSSERK